MASVPPDRRSTRRFRRPTAAPPPAPPSGRPAHSPQDQPSPGPRFDRPPPAGNDWYPPPEPAPPREEPRRPRSGDRRRPHDRDVRRPVPPAPLRGRRRGRARRPRRLLARIARVLAVLVVVQALLLLSLRWVDPPTTAFMAANPDGSIQQSVPVEHVSRTFLAAVIAHEDAALPYRAGAFNWTVLWSRAWSHLSGEEDPSGSTIPQQVAKNLFLNQELSAGRKAVEAALAVELAFVLDDRRMLELYVNYAQFGPTIYGVCAAGWYYFDSPPESLSPAESVQLVGLLPSPGHVRRAPGGGMDFQVEDGLGWLSRSHVINAQNRVPRHLDALGFTPVEDAGVEGLASEQEPSDDDCSEPPQEVTDLIAAEGTG
ncbi:glycosyl transferase [Blastococcus sp. TBT05-19]|uniref:transglycosylase domain-containing protein n=1 Tax=Blastococcus sp. TBT05-19 TaxID=2250581 RepID=UPI000DE932EC|nr:transglycosylase domain-containing protein [Blastococcus sp. TBT05-19]RBY88093.1 glycosyl transferase [Blastococcus sp. TBT05-19]